MSRGIIESDLIIVKELLQKAIGKSDYVNIERLGGLTNRTYRVDLKEEKYVVRIPGEGTERLIIRKNEKISTELAYELGIDAKLLYFGNDGSKVTRYIPNAVTMNEEKMIEIENIKQVANIFRILHNCQRQTGVLFNVFDMATGYEKIIHEECVNMYDDYNNVKEKVMRIKDRIDATCIISRVPCHNDPLCENWIMSGDAKMYLIDWEYAGMNDGFWDLADVSIEALYNQEHDKLLLTEYLGHTPVGDDWKRFIANKLYVDFLWTLWAKARVPYDGQVMEEWSAMRYTRLKKNIQIFQSVFGEEIDK